MKITNSIVLIAILLASPFAYSEKIGMRENQYTETGNDVNPYSGANLLIVPSIPTQPQSTTSNGPNGLVTTQNGSTTYYTNGPSSITNGNKTIYSNGKSCITNGTKKICN